MEILEDLNINIPQDLIRDGIISSEEMNREFRKFIAMELFRKKVISIGKAASIANMERGQFGDYLGEHNIPMSSYSAEDLDKDLEYAKNFRRE